MPFISDGRDLIARAFRQRFAMPAFNVCSLEMASACVSAAEAERAPIILQTFPGDLEHAEPSVMAGMIRALAETVDVPVMLHLDHGADLAMAARCLRAGYSSVMFDGDALPLHENVAATRRVVEVAHAACASCEAAAGNFGDEGEGGAAPARLTDPDDAATLMRQSGADMVAVAVGSRHGRTSTLDLGRLRDIAAAVEAPLVLHGGTGVPHEQVAAAAAMGVVKVNIGAGLYRPLLAAWRREAAGAEWHYDVFRAARADLQAAAREKIRATGAAGRA